LARQRERRDEAIPQARHAFRAEAANPFGTGLPKALKRHLASDWQAMIPMARASASRPRAKQVFPKVAAGFGSKNLLDKGS
jgi:hypothetical protein